MVLFALLISTVNYQFCHLSPADADAYNPELHTLIGTLLPETFLVHDPGIRPRQTFYFPHDYLRLCLLISVTCSFDLVKL